VIVAFNVLPVSAAPSKSSAIARSTPTAGGLYSVSSELRRAKNKEGDVRIEIEYCGM
jgi:hypothetical protein